MSSYYCQVKIKKTGEIKDAIAQDNYFGHHQYGYYVENDNIYKEDEVEIIFETDKIKLDKIIIEEEEKIDRAKKIKEEINKCYWWQFLKKYRLKKEWQKIVKSYKLDSW